MNTELKITLENCNNIDKGTIKIIKSKLNIKFGINGTGKSTIAKAIQFIIENPEKLADLLPFKLQDGNKNNLQSNIKIEPKEYITKVLVFNEEYLNQFVYKKDELISNSFKIFIKTSEYTSISKKIETQLKKITTIFSENKELEQTISDFDSLSSSFKTTQKGLSDNSAICKGLRNGNQLENIPQELEDYRPFLQNREKCVDWLDWQIKGSNFSDGHDNCPYCVSYNDEAVKKKIKSLSENYDKDIIKKFIIIIEILKKLGDYFSDDSKAELNRILQKKEGLLDEEKNYITTIKGQIDSFLKRLKNLKDISFINLKDDEKIKEKIEGFIINIDELFDKLKSNKTEEIVNLLNKSLNKTLEEIGTLQGNINRQKRKISKLIEKHKANINQFLKNAGYKYEVIIEDEQGEYKIKLKHIDSKQSISGGDQYLSFGEKNAFSLVLFMYQALSEKPDLIILDDPISSFDKNKKYAIMNILFRANDCLKNKTVLMLTHDIEPIIDTIKVLKEFRNLTNANFLFLENGELKEKSIEEKDLLSFTQICKNIIDLANINPLTKVIYLRRYYEIANKGDGYEVISNLLHKRSKDKAEDHRKEGEDKTMNPNDFDNGVEEIQKLFISFDYDKILETIINKESLKKIYNLSENGYEKLHLSRIINDNSSNNVLKKFINESYHVENDLIYQLNPMKYDLIPKYIVDHCNDFFKSHYNE